MTPRPQPTKCKSCNVEYLPCGLKLQDCSITRPISDAELEFILQTNEHLPTDELELPVRDMIVMGIREKQPCASHSSAPTGRDKVLDILTLIELWISDYQDLNGNGEIDPEQLREMLESFRTHPEAP